jgi:hypothetical protein
LCCCASRFRKVCEIIIKLVHLFSICTDILTDFHRLKFIWTDICSIKNDICTSK